MTHGGYFDLLWLANGSRDTSYILLIILVACILLIWKLPKSKLNLPKGPTGIPFLGYLPFLGKEPHKTFDKLKEKYGSVFRLSLGPASVIVLADYPAAEDALSKPESLNRPSQMFDFLPEGVGFGGTNGPQWVEGRRFAIRTLRNLGLGKTGWIRLIEEELSDFVENIARSKGQPIDISKLLGPSIANNILSLIFGKRFPEEAVLALIETSLTEFFTPSSLWNFFPWLCTILCKIKFGYYNKIDRKIQHYHNFFKNEIQNSMKKESDDKGTDFVAEYLEFLRDSRKNGRETLLNERMMIGDTQALFNAGTDTTHASLTWLFLIVAAFPEVQEKVYAELESVLGNQEMPLWEDHVKFPYTNAVIMEAQRWRTVAPLNVPRLAGEDMKILGFDIPKGSMIITNNWGLHNDVRYWKNPGEFIPERFLKNEGKEVNSKLESYVPFSIGKRKCPGESVAMMELFLYFTAVIQKYEVRVPSGRKPNLDGTMGIIYFPLRQELCFVLRENPLQI